MELHGRAHTQNRGPLHALGRALSIGTGVSLTRPGAGQLIEEIYQAARLRRTGSPAREAHSAGRHGSGTAPCPTMRGGLREP